MSQVATKEYPVYIIWPEERWVKRDQIITWFTDAVANMQIAPGRLRAETSMEMASALDDAGLITLGIPHMNKHTPGPWRIEYDPYCHVRSDAGCVLASDYTTEANARLIAAAPDLLAAVKAQHDALDILLAMLVQLDPKFMPTQSRAWPALLQGNAAIAKAEQ